MPVGGECPDHPRPRRVIDRSGHADRPTATARGYGAAWRRVRAVKLAKAPSCEWCGAEATVVDHVIAKRDGGSDHPSNLQSLCDACHARKTGLERVAWHRRRRRHGAG